MDRVKDYLKEARECRELAKQATSPEMAKKLREMAESWEALARQRSAYVSISKALGVENGNGNGHST